MCFPSNVSASSEVCIFEGMGNPTHSAGIAVLPEYRGNNFGLTLRAKQIEICKEKKATTLFCETTNRFSAVTVEKAGFFKIAAYPYKDLAVELSHSDLNKLDDSFSVWCRTI
jgi:GNAT superfamily N-acetyltransferase